MSKMIFIHEATRQYAYPIDRDCIEIKMKSTAVCTSCGLVYWNRQKNKDDDMHDEIAMECYAKDKYFSHYRARIEGEESIKYLRYYFKIQFENETMFLNTYGTQCSMPSDGFFEYLYVNTNDVFKVPEWTQSSVFYQIFPERFYNGNKNNDPKSIEKWNSKPTRENFFGGDISGIIKKLDYLKDLDIDAIYLNPIFKAPSNHKYDTIDYYQIDESFGSLDDFKQLVKRCHEYDIKVVIDGVFNHCGYYFEPFQDVLKLGENSKYKDWFYIDEFPVNAAPPNYECVGYYKWMPKINLSNREARDYFLSVGRYWIEHAAIDGWRLDVSDEVDFTFWSEFRRNIKDIKKDAVLIGETWKDGRDLLRGDQMDSVMNYLFRNAAVDFIAKGIIDCNEFDSRIQNMLTIYPSMVYDSLYNLIGSHDTERFLTLCNNDLNKLKMAVAFQMTFPGMPVIYYGDELGMTGDNDPDCRKAMTWENENSEIHEFYKKLIKIRKSNEALSKGNFQSILCQNGVYAFCRKHENRCVYVVLNNSDKPMEIDLSLFDEHTHGEYISLMDNKSYKSAEIAERETFWGSNVNDYKSFFKMSLSAYHFEIIIKKEIFDDEKKQD